MPYAVVSYALFVRKDSPVKALKDLRGKEIVFQNGRVMYTYLKNEVQPSRIVAVMDAPEVLKLLSSGRHDGAFLPEIQGHYLAEKLKLSNLKKVEASIPSKMFCFAVPRGMRNCSINSTKDSTYSRQRATTSAFTKSGSASTTEL